MYWTQQDKEDPAVVKASMDGSGLEFLKKVGLVQPTSIAFHKNFNLYWVDHVGRRIEYTNTAGKRPQSFGSLKYAPKRMVIDGDNMYWVGRLKDANSEAIFTTPLDFHGPKREEEEKYIISRNLTGITGLCAHDADSRWKIRGNPCEQAKQCAGICLLSTKRSFRCACPVGFEPSGTNGSSCTGSLLLPPSVIY